MGSDRLPFRPKDLQNPNKIFSNLLEDYISGVLTDYTFLFRAVVVQIDTIGGQLSGPNTNKPDDFPNPPNSVKARILTKDQYKSTDNLNVFWPIFSHDIMPIKEGEHVYVLFENPNEQTRGLWLSRAPEPNTVTNTNLVLGSDKYKNLPTSNNIGLEQATAGMQTAPDPIKQSADYVNEKPQIFHIKVGDRVIEGSNNTIIILGAAPPVDDSSNLASSPGTITIIASNIIIDGQKISLGDLNSTNPHPAVLGDQLVPILTHILADLKSLAAAPILSPAGPGTVNLPPASLQTANDNVNSVNSNTVKVKP